MTHITDGNPNTTSLLKRVFMFLEDGEWASANEYCEKVLDINPECAEAYLGKLMAELHVKKRENLKDQTKCFDKSNNYKKAIRFADAQLKTELENYVGAVNSRVEQQLKIAQKKKKTIVFTAITSVCVVAAFVFLLITVIIPSAKYNDAVALMNEGKYYEAISKFDQLDGYKDSKQQISECEKLLYIEEHGQKAFDNCGMLRRGDYITLGRYEQDGDLSNGEEQIEWLVLDIQGGKALVISKHVLTVKKFANDLAAWWETSDLRDWLNKDFYYSTFSISEKNCIDIVSISNANGTYGDFSSGDRETMDLVFLLSIEEVNKYFGDARCTSTVASANNGDVGYHSWLLRTPGDDLTRVAFVDWDGSINNFGYAVDSYRGVRPAMWIDLSKYIQEPSTNGDVETPSSDSNEEITTTDTDVKTESNTIDNVQSETPTISSLSAPTDILTEYRERTSFTVSWSAVSGAAGYNVYLDGKKVNSKPITETSYKVTGLSPSTYYEFTVTSVNSAGGESAQGDLQTTRTRE